MTEWIEHAGSWTLRNSLEGGLLILLLGMLALAGHRWLSPRQRAVLWGLAAARLVLPFAPESAVSLFNAFPIAESEVNGIVLPDLSSPLPIVSEEIPTQMTAAAPEAVSQGGFEFTMRWGGLWLLGVMAVLGTAVMQQIRASLRLRRFSEATDARVHKLFEECLLVFSLQDAGLRLVESPRAGEIGVYGVVRGRCVVVPATMGDDYSEEEMRGILLHELAHVRRWDLLRNWLTLVVQALHWFNPLVWWLGSRLRAERELLCDQWALRNSSSRDRRSYGQALLKTLQKGLRPPRACSAFVPFLSRKSELKHRLTMITKPRLKNHRSAQVAMLGVALLACASTFTSAVAASEDKRERKSARSSTAAPKEKGARSQDRGTLDVYLNRRGTYVSGKKQKSDQLARLVRKEGREGVVLTVEQGLEEGTIRKVVSQLKKAGAPRVKRKTYIPVDKAQAAIEKVGERMRDAEGALQVYLSNRGVWIKGAQLPAGVLTKLARRHGKEGVVVSSEPDVSRERIKMIVDQIKDGGVKKVRVTKLVPKEKRGEKSKRVQRVETKKRSRR